MAKPFQLVPKVEWYNDLLLPLSYYPVINVPKGVLSVCPHIVDTTRFQQVLNADPPPITSTSSISLGVRGLTKSYFFMRFPDFANQWKLLSNGAYQFQGGDVEICIGIKIYVKEYNWPGKSGADSCTLAEFALIMEHEYKHAEDDIATIKAHMPAVIQKKKYVQNWLRDQKTISAKDFQRWFAGYAKPRPLDESVWFNPYPAGVQFEKSLLPDWAADHNRRADHMDDPAGTEMTKLADRFGDISLNHQTGRHWKGKAGSDPWKD